MIIYFESLTFELNVYYVFNKYVKFCVNWMLFAI